MKKKNSISFLFVLLLSIITILITGERAALVSTLIFFVIAFILFDFSKKYKIILLVITTFSIITFLQFDENLKKRIGTIFDSLNSSSYIYENFDKIDKDIPENVTIFSQQHAKHYITGIRLFFSEPVVGIGPKNFRKLCAKEPFALRYGCSTHPHNTYVQLLSETGLIGFVLIFSLFCYHVFILFKIFINKYFYKTGIFNSSVSIYIAIFINLWPIAPNGSFYNNWNSIIFYIPIALILFFNNYEKNNK